MEKFKVIYELKGKQKHAVVTAETEEKARDYAEKMLNSIYPANNCNLTVKKEV